MMSTNETTTELVRWLCRIDAMGRDKDVTGSDESCWGLRVDEEETAVRA